MTKNATFRAPRATTELVVIVIGILLALWADASWDARRARAEELAYLHALRDDFAQLEIDVDARVHRYDEGVQDLARLIQARSTDVPSDSVDQWLAGGFFDIDQFEAPLTTLDDLMATGQLGVLTSTTLRSQLAGLVRMLEHFSDLEAEVATVQFDHIDPFLIEFGDIGRIGRTRGNGEVVPRVAWDNAPLLSAPNLDNLANLKLFTVTGLRDQLIAIAATAEAVLVTIDMQLES